MKIGVCPETGLDVFVELKEDVLEFPVFFVKRSDEMFLWKHGPHGPDFGWHAIPNAGFGLSVTDAASLFFEHVLEVARTKKEAVLGFTNRGWESTCPETGFRVQCLVVECLGNKWWQISRSDGSYLAVFYDYDTTYEVLAFEIMWDMEGTNFRNQFDATTAFHMLWREFKNKERSKREWLVEGF